MTRKGKLAILFSINSLFIFLFSFLLTRNVTYTMYSLALVSLISAGFFLAFSSQRFFFKLLFLLIPLSTETVVANTTIHLFFPSELLAGVMAISFVIHSLFYLDLDRKLLFHPLSIAVLIYFLVLLLSSFSSADTAVSLKVCLLKFCYISVFYFFLHSFLKKDIKNIRTVFLFYGLSLLVIILYSLYHHSIYHFEKSMSSAVVKPFFADHTIYSACIAFVLPAFTFFILFPVETGFRKLERVILIALTAILYIGLFYSYSRAAWLSLAVSILFSLALLIKIRFRTLVFFLLAAGALLYLNRGNLIDEFNQNRNDSNAKNAGIEEQTKSITNIHSDISNAERLNRWKCAIRMVCDRPVLGFGPGTYQFQYLSYQLKPEMTRISVTSPYNIQFGHGGTAHSEYMLALSEGGILGLSVFVLLILIAVRTAMKNVYDGTDGSVRTLCTMTLLGLTTYLVHGLFNNFLDTDKIAFLFWSSLSILVTIDLNKNNLPTSK